MSILWLFLFMRNGILFHFLKVGFDIFYLFELKPYILFHNASRHHIILCMLNKILVKGLVFILYEYISMKMKTEYRLIALSIILTIINTIILAVHIRTKNIHVAHTMNVITNSVVR
jgi:hypothetical protein